MSSINYLIHSLIREQCKRRGVRVKLLLWYLQTRCRLEERVIRSRIRSICNKYYTTTDLRLLSSISPWDNIVSNMSNAGFMSFLNLDVKTFFLLHSSFKYYFYQFTPYAYAGLHCGPGGRVRRITSLTCLALVLNYFNTVDKMRVLHVSFLMPPSTCSIYLNYGVRCLALVIDVCIGRSVGHCPYVEGFTIEFPTDPETLERYYLSLLRKYPRLDQARGKVFGFLDGTKVSNNYCSRTILQ